MRAVHGMWNRIQSAANDWAEAERQTFALWLPVAMGAGILTYDALLFEPAFWIGPVATCASFVLAALLRQWRLPRGIMAAVAAAALGFASAQWATARAPPPETRLSNRAMVVQGRIKAVEILPEGRRLTLDAVVLEGAEPPLERYIRVRIKPNDGVALATGETIRVRALIRSPGPPTHPGAWDQQRDAFFSGLAGSGYAIGAVEIMAREPPGGFQPTVQRLREVATERIAAAIPGAAGPVAVGILIGAQTGIAGADLTAFRDSGLAHILSVSGLHIAIVMGFVMATLRLCFALSEHASLFWPTRQLAAVGALVAGGVYTVFTGAQVPMLRCFVMALLFTLALLFYRRAMPLRGLGLAGIVVMLAEPNAVSGVSFQMSFSAVLALIAGFAALRPWLKRLEGKTWPRRLAAYLAAGALTSLLAGAASAPFGVFHFGRMQVYFVVANMAAAPFTSVLVMPAGMIALLAMPFGLEALPLAVCGWGVEAVLWIARLVASWPEATVMLPHPPGWGLAVLSLGTIWLSLWRGRVRWAGLLAIGVGMASPALEPAPDLLIAADGRLIAIRTDEGVYIQQVNGGSKFTRDAWLHYWAERESRPFPAMGGGGGGALLNCVKDSCLLRSRADGAVALLARGPGKLEGCSSAAIVVSAEPARGLCPRPWPRLVDRFTVWREGATAVWLDPDGVRILTDRQARGVRPWTPPLPVARAQPVPKLPLAEVDRVE